MSTIIPPRGPMPTAMQDCAELYRAFKGFGSDDKKIITILAHRNYVQRHELRRLYSTLYSQNLLDRLKSELHGNLEKAVILWMQDAPERDATIMRDALRGWGTQDTALIEMVCSRTTSQLQAIRHAYNSMYQRSLDADISSDTSGDYRKLLLAYLNNHRPETPHIDMHLAESDARSLYQAGEARLGTDEETIIHILSTRSAAQLTASFHKYRQMYGRDIEKAMKRETSGQFLNSLRAIIRCVQYPPQYFAKMLHKSMKGIGTRDEMLIRVIVTRAEIDMQLIKTEFSRKYNKRLEDMISSETSGNYKKFLLALVGSGSH